MTGERVYAAVPVTVDGQPLLTRRPAPRFDEHTDEVLAEWGDLAQAEIAELRAAEEVGTVPRQPSRR